MKRPSSLAFPRPSTCGATATACTGRSVGRSWNVTAGALAWSETQIAQGPETLASECAWVDSSPAKSKARHTQVKAAMRCQLRISNWLSPIRCFCS